MTAVTRSARTGPGENGLIRNPVLPGFNPDPCILRVGADYYIATSTFEWYPGVRVHHSTDLVHWRPLGGILTERRLLDLAGAADSAGIWAPDLSYVDGVFYLVYTDVSSFASGYWDSQNYVVSATDLAGPWSDPVPLHARGFDPSIFHDEDGSSWLLTMGSDWRPGRDPFGGIRIQAYDRAAGKLVGDERLIFEGTSTGLTEGPRLYRRDGWYYLVTAEGGTSWPHQVTVARSRALHGPYEVDPDGPLLTSFGRPDLTLQKAGHGSLVSTPDGEWYLAHLVARPYSPLGRCVLGRETAIQSVTWEPGGWPRIEGGRPSETAPAPAGATAVPARSDSHDGHDDFDGPVLGPDWSTLRRPATSDWLQLTSRRSHLRIFGGQSPVGRQRPSLVARRVTAPHCVFETTMEFDPATFRQLAGITAYYNSRNWHYAYVTVDDEGRRMLEVMSCDTGRRTPHPDCRVDVTGVDRIRLRVRFDGPVVRFAYSSCPSVGSAGVGAAKGSAGDDWRELPVELDATILSDEYASILVEGEPDAWGFTGAFVGLWVQDLGADGGFADFDSATYEVVRHDGFQPG
ncbi:glycoside hydrolase family 43 protein [Plantactinospora sp. S1510]|uniref:Glycoside hydrolase family 43 protein n=1 Tax=Plantactinospora alkalitolerans TaxID=2789879 RepID=A0ABS0GWE4_9ACTN|nr:glycoside hydrolase family 43 protein [Plantactinospora alkalitolerans]MBF9130536.1 glycoside hydrolase family 43 protein [Plantactinospora alkalitolerans]